MFKIQSSKAANLKVQCSKFNVQSQQILKFNIQSSKFRVQAPYIAGMAILPCNMSRMVLQSEWVTRQIILFFYHIGLAIGKF